MVDIIKTIKKYTNNVKSCFIYLNEYLNSEYVRFDNFCYISIFRMLLSEYSKFSTRDDNENKSVIFDNLYNNIIYEDVYIDNSYIELVIENLNEENYLDMIDVMSNTYKIILKLINIDKKNTYYLVLLLDRLRDKILTNIKDKLKINMMFFLYKRLYCIYLNNINIDIVDLCEELILQYKKNTYDYYYTFSIIYGEKLIYSKLRNIIVEDINDFNYYIAKYAILFLTNDLIEYYLMHDNNIDYTRFKILVNKYKILYDKFKYYCIKNNILFDSIYNKIINFCIDDISNKYDLCNEYIFMINMKIDIFILELNSKITIIDHHIRGINMLEYLLSSV